MNTLERTAPQLIEYPALRAMFEARKRVFVDLLGWDVPVLAGRYEIDQFDTPEAVYLLLVDAQGRHRASARLLQTSRPHILADLFPMLCEYAVPRNRRTWEITRFCIDPQLSRAERRTARDELVSVLVDHALEQGIESYTAVANLPWSKQIARFGWQCRPLGQCQKVRGEILVGFQIEIDSETPVALARKGIYRPVELLIRTGMERPL